MVSRRLFLTALGGVAVVGVGGAVGLDRSPRLAHKLGLQNSPDGTPPPADVRMEEGTLYSRAAIGPARWALALPPKEDARATIFVLHGRGDDHTAAFRRLRIQDFAAQAGLPVAIAAVDGGQSYWHQRADGSNTLAMLLDEFIPLIEAKTGTDARAITGWSMGGYGALLAASERPGFFAAVSALSPALWTRAQDSAPGAFDDASDFRRNDVFARRSALNNVAVQVSCGNGDPFVRATKSFVSTLPRAQSNFGEGFHEDAYWRSVMPETLRFLAGRTLTV